MVVESDLMNITSETIEKMKQEIVLTDVEDNSKLSPKDWMFFWEEACYFISSHHLVNSPKTRY